MASSSSCPLTTTKAVVLPDSLALYSDWHFCSSCGLPPASTSKDKKPKKLSTCSRCKTVAYRSVECQKNHWKAGHKHDCKVLAQAIQPLLNIAKCWSKNHSNRNNNSNNDISWWDLDRLDPIGANQSHRLWETSEIRWNRRGEYLEAMAGFQKALEPVSKLWKKHTSKATKPKSGDNHNTKNGDESTDECRKVLSNLSLQQKGNKTNEALIAKGISLARKLLFCSYCEADGNQIQASRMRLAQCITILLECAQYDHKESNNNNNSSLDPQPKRKNSTKNSISLLLNDAWMELMLSYEEEGSSELRRISRHVVHLAIQSSCGNTLYHCDWKDPLQRPGYMATLETTNGNSFNSINGTADNDEEKPNHSVYAPPYIPPENHPQWCKTLESHWREIAAELSSLIHRDRNTTLSYNNNNQWTVVGSGERGSGEDDHRVVSPGGKWTEYVLFGTGSCDNAPFTKSLLRQCVPDAVSLAEAGGGEVIFSKLEPHTRIAAHCGPTNFRWTAHLGLVIPSSSSSQKSNCSIRVADQWHQWQTGKVLLFDDSYEHEIRNDTNEVRIVLLLRLWHPGLAPHRRQTELNRALRKKEEAVEKRYKAPIA